MNAVIDSKLTLYNLPSDVKYKVIADLTLKNPLYHRLKAMGISTYGTPDQIKLFKREGSQLTVPRGYASKLNLDDFVVEDNTVMNLRQNFCSIIKLRDYQEKAVLEIIKHKCGVVVLPCGSGKTIIGLEAAVRISQPTLWLTHTSDLLNQSLNAAKNLLGLKKGEFGVIGGGKFSIGTKITFATVQTLSKRDLSEIKDFFGCVIIDECHHTVSDEKHIRQFESVISELPAKYRIGLTASEHRSDGLIETMYYIIGSKLYEISQDDLIEQGYCIVPDVFLIPTRFNYISDTEQFNFSGMLKEIAEDYHRNEIILKWLKILKETDSTLVLADNLSHLRYLKDKLNTEKTVFICGSTSSKERASALADMQNGTKNILFATYALAKEGLDIPRLNKLFLLTPKKDRTVIQQSVGRIMRLYEDEKTAAVYDFYDPLLPVSTRQLNQRIREVYKNLKCKIERIN